MSIREAWTKQDGEINRNVWQVEYCFYIPRKIGGADTELY